MAYLLNNFKKTYFVKIDNIRFIFINVVLLATYLLFTFHKFLGVDRSVIEAVIILSSIFFFDKNCIAPLFAVVGTMLIHAYSGNKSYYFDLANLPLIILFSKSIKVSKLQLNSLIIIQLIILAFFAIINEYFGFYVDDMRNSGPFASSLHLSYLLICISFGIFVTNPSFFYIVNTVCLFLAILSASRASIVFCFTTYLLKLYKYRNILSVVMFSAICIFYYLYGRRSLGLESGNDDVRIMGYYNFYKYISPENIFFGLGRSEYGSIGIRVHGKENVLITESSLLMMIYTQGFIFAFIFIGKFFVVIRNILIRTVQGLAFAPIWIAIILLVPFLDSPSVSVLNILMLKCIESAVSSNE